MYAILPIKKRKIQKAISDLPPAQRDKLRDAFLDIERDPFHHPGGKIGRLKGDWADRGYHYRLSDSCRIHYVVDEKNKTVTITYVGPHPNY